MKLIWLFGLLVLTSSCFSLTLHVPGNYNSIQSAIVASADGDTVLVAPFTYNENINFLGKAITVAGLYLVTGDLLDIDLTILSGTGNGSVVKFVTNETANSRLIGFTIINGIANSAPPNDCGGGIYCQNSNPVLNSLRIAGNEALKGGGIGLMGASPHISNVIIYDNGVGSFGGGIACYSGSNPLIENALIHSNTAMMGAGIAAQNNSSPVLINCTVVNNSVAMPHFAGGFDCYGICSPVVMNCIFWGNSMHQIVNSSEMHITNSCIQNEQSGVSNDPGAILNWLTGNIGGDPLFVDALNADFHVIADSPCNTGGISTCDIGALTYFAPIFDLDMLPRPTPSNTNPDMGVYENQGPVDACFTADITSGMAPLTVQFTDTSVGNPVVWLWDFDTNGMIDSFEQNPVWTYSAAGVYTVTLTISNGIADDCETLDDYITVSPTSNQDENQAYVPVVRILPNPANNNSLLQTP